MNLVDLKKAEEIVGPVLQELGFELVQIRFLNAQGRWVLQIMIDREGGVTVGDCQKVTREVETVLEIEEVVGQRYCLEVSSPGLERPLVKEADYLRYAGKVISLKTRQPLSGRQNYKGRLDGVEQGAVLMTIDGQRFQIPFGEIEKAHLIYLGKGEEDVSRSRTHH